MLSKEVRVYAMRRKWFRGVATGALTVVAIAACGAGTLTHRASIAPASRSATTITSDRSPTTKYESRRYCQLLANGKWVTNNTAYSATPCVPDPSYATGDEALDGSRVIPRCVSCKLSDWKRAEARMATSAPGGDNITIPDAGDPSEWSVSARTKIIGACTTRWGDNPSVCRCVVNRVAQQIPAYEAGDLSPEDTGVRAAAIACGEAEPQP